MDRLASTPLGQFVPARWRRRMVLPIAFLAMAEFLIILWLVFHVTWGT